MEHAAAVVPQPPAQFPALAQGAARRLRRCALPGLNRAAPQRVPGLHRSLRKALGGRLLRQRLIGGQHRIRTGQGRVVGKGQAVEGGDVRRIRKRPPGIALRIAGEGGALLRRQVRRKTHPIPLLQPRQRLRRQVAVGVVRLVKVVHVGCAALQTPPQPPACAEQSASPPACQRPHDHGSDGGFRLHSRLPSSASLHHNQFGQRRNLDILPSLLLNPGAP